MKIFAYYAAALVLLVGAGCGQKDNGSTESMNKPAQSSTEMAMPVKEDMAPAEVQSESVVQKVAEESKEAVSALKVKTEDVMADLGQSVDELKQKAASFDKTQLLAYVDQYKTVILEKKDQIAALTDQIKKVPVTEMMGNEALMLKEQLGKYTQDFNALKERYTVYLDKLKEYGVDLSAYTL